MKTIKKVKNYTQAPETVFHQIDDLGVTGMHMEKSSGMMMGSKLNLQFLTVHKTGLGTQYRWIGKMMGMKMDFTVEVTKWVEGKEKIWETIGETKLIIYSWYSMHLITTKTAGGTVAELSISYNRPKGFFYTILSVLFADWYCNWCLNNMLNDAEKALTANSENS